MKRFAQLLFVLCLFIAVACQKEPFLQLSSPSSISFTDQGGSQSISMTTNRSWTVSSSESWCKVSPASGEASESGVSITVTCEPNTTYNSRSCAITINAEGLTQSIAVSQETNLGLIVSQTAFDLSSDTQTIEVEVRANVKYAVEIDAACESWIRHVSTRALESNILVFQISENESYDERVGQITIRQADGIFAETITIRQSKAEGYASIPIEDPIFKAYLVSLYDIDADGEINSKEALEITAIDVESDGIQSLQGIEFMPHLSFLKSKCPLNNLDVSKNNELTYLYCVRNNLKSLDVSNNTALTYLRCGGNEITSLDVSNNLALETLWCSGDNLSNLDLSNNSSLRYLYCPNNNLTSLDISNNTQLEYLMCNDNQITTLNLSNNPKLDSVYCFRNRLNSIDLSNTAALKMISCGNNLLTNIDLSNSTALEYLDCSGNLLSYLDISYNTLLRELWCTGMNDSNGNNLLSTIYVGQNQHIIPGVTIYRNSGDSPNIPFETTIVYVPDRYDNNKQITDAIPIEDPNFKAYLITYYDIDWDGEISFSEAEKIELVSVGSSHNSIFSLQGIEYMPNLKNISCGGLKLKTLDVSNNPNLISLTCKDNDLVTLDLTNNPKLRYIRCQNNKLTNIYFTDMAELTDLDCSDNQLMSLDLSCCPKLVFLSCSSNSLSSLDASDKAALVFLECKHNMLKSLSISGAISLQELNCYFNQLNSLDVSHNTKLYSINCSYNYLTSLDVSNNKQLARLFYSPQLDNTKITIIGWH